jgi:osmotically-inducible protein OsmY
MRVAGARFSCAADLGAAPALQRRKGMATPYKAFVEEPFELRCLHVADADIEDEVREIVATTCDGADIVVLVEQGRVTLTGEVPERWMLLEIEHAALHARGARSLVSRLRAPDRHAHDTQRGH